MGLESLEGAMASWVGGKKIVLAGGVVAGTTPRVAQLRRLGAERVLIVGSSIGTGALPDAEDAEWVVADTKSRDTTEGLRADETMLRDPPAEIRHALERYDPAGEALVFGSIPGSPTHFGDRPILGGRPPEWGALEDKTVIDDLWHRWGVPSAPSVVLPVEEAGLRHASRELDQGMGTAWAGDARDGFHGAAECLRWVRTEDDRRDALAFFAPRCDRVRVMPFLEGISCSIHGFVFPDGVARLRPVEQVALRRVGRPLVLYAGCSTFWDPPEDDRVAMREVAGRTARGLAALVGYRGAFTVDGVLASGGFLPTEMNPRLGGGVATIARGLPGVPFDLLQAALVADVAVGLGADEFEREVLPEIDATRSGGTWSTTETPPPGGSTTTEHDLVLDEDACRFAEPRDRPTARLSYGPGPIGGFVRVQFDPEHTPVGPSVGPRAVRALRFADETFGTGFGPLESARPVR